MSNEKELKQPEVKEVQAEEKTVDENPESNPKQPEQTEEKHQEDAEPTLGEALQTDTKEKPGKPDSVPFDAFEMSKKEAKKFKEEAENLKKEIEQLKSLKEEGSTPKELQDAYSELADEYNVDKTFIQKLAKGLETNLAERLRGEVEERLRPLTEKEKLAEQNVKFDQFYKNAIQKFDNGKKIVNKEVIRTLAFQPQNSGKTISQLIEETYGNAIAGRPTIESTTPGGGKEPESVDFDRAKTDSTYFKEVMSDPKLKAEYNAGIAQRIDW